jgi:hypothetical protein
LRKVKPYNLRSTGPKKKWRQITNKGILLAVQNCILMLVNATKETRTAEATKTEDHKVVWLRKYLI